MTSTDEARFEEDLDEVFALGKDESFVDLAARAAARGDDEAPEAIGDYVVLGEVARGGQGIVYRARNRDNGADVALKRLPLDASSQARTRFEREMRACVALEHPNIVRVLGIMREESGAAIAMEWVDGESFVRWARPRAEPPRCTQQILSTFCDVCHGVEHAHERGILHRDIKPTNILVENKSGRAKLLDFGISKFVGDGPSQASTDTTGLSTRTSIFVGTLRYAAPEQIANKSQRIDARLDVYSLGVVLYEALTGRAPYDFGAGLVDAVQAIAGEAPARLSTQTIGARQLDRILAKCLAKRPRDRYRSVAALREDVERHLSGKRVHAPRPPSRIRRRLLRATALAAGITATGFAAHALGAFASAEAPSPAARAERFLQQIPRLSVSATSTQSAALEGSLRQLDEPRREAELRLELGEVLHDNGYSDLAVAHLESAQRILRAVGAAKPERLRCSLALFDAYHHLGASAAAHAEIEALQGTLDSRGISSDLRARVTLAVARDATTAGREGDATRALDSLPSKLPPRLEVDRAWARVALGFTRDASDPEAHRRARKLRARLQEQQERSLAETKTLLTLCCHAAADESQALEQRVAALDEALAHNASLSGRRYSALRAILVRIRRFEALGVEMSTRWERLRATLERRGCADAFTKLVLHRARERKLEDVDTTELALADAIEAFRRMPLASPLGMSYLRDAVEVDALLDQAAQLSSHPDATSIAQARSAAERALALRRRLVGDRHRSLGSAMQMLARVLENGGGSAAETKQAYRRAIQIHLRVQPHGNAAAARICLRLARFAEAIKDRKLRDVMYEVADQHERELAPGHAAFRVDLHLGIARLEAERGKLASAKSRWESAFATAFGAPGTLGDRPESVHTRFLTHCATLQKRLQDLGATLTAESIGSRTLAAFDAQYRGRGSLPRSLRHRRRRLAAATAALRRR